MKNRWPAFLLLSVCAIRASADRDIVYSARYYAPPGSRQTSHFHIYRINPDGTGKTQLTFGAYDEEVPQWTDGGRHVTFLSYDGTASVKLCQINADGSKRRVLRTLGETEVVPAPPTPGYRLENIIADTGNAPTQHILINAETGQRQTLAVPEHDDDNDALLPMPGTDIVYAANNHNSTVGTDYFFYRLNPSTGVLRPLTGGQFLAWSPDGSRFCVARGRDTAVYEKRPDGRDRLVWFAPLYVRAAGGGPMRQLTPRLSWVIGADWRKDK